MEMIDKILDTIEKSVVVIALAGMLLLILVATFARVLNVASIPWGEEAARYLMIWLAMIALSTGFRDDAHLGLSFFVDKFKGGAKKALLIIRAVIILLFCVMIVYQGVLLMVNQMEYVQHSPALRIPMYFLYASIPVGYFLSIVRLTICTIRQLKQVEAN